MRHFIRTWFPALLLCLLIWRPADAHTSSPGFTVWTSGQGLTAQALNDSLAHIHNTFTGGIVDSHVSATAAISHSKLATPSLLPRAWAYTVAPTNVAGVILVSSPVAIFTFTRTASVGVFTYTISPARPDANYMLQVTAQGTTAAVADNQACFVRSRAAGSGNFECYNNAGAAVDPPRFDVILYDDNGTP